MKPLVIGLLAATFVLGIGFVAVVLVAMKVVRQETMGFPPRRGYPYWSSVSKAPFQRITMRFEDDRRARGPFAGVRADDISSRFSR